jgi:predicted esterase
MQQHLLLLLLHSSCLSRIAATCEDHSTTELCSSATADCTWYDGYGCYASKATKSEDAGKGAGGTGTGSLTGPKILVLHGGGGNAVGTRSSAPFQQLMNSLPGFQFVYAQGGYSQGGGNLWIPDPPTKNEPTTSATVADASLQILDDIVRTQGPFYGILGYSQGSAFVPVYLSHAPANTFQVAMMYCGYLTTTHQGLLGLVNAASPFNNIASLVWMGGQDTIITNAMTDAQAAKFTDPVRLLDANAGHSLPLTTSPTFAKVISFVNNNTATAAHQGKDSLAWYPPVHPAAATIAYDDSSTSVTPFKMSVPLIGAVVALLLF